VLVFAAGALAQPAGFERDSATGTLLTSALLVEALALNVSEHVTVRAGHTLVIGGAAALTDAVVGGNVTVEGGGTLVVDSVTLRVRGVFFRVEAGTAAALTRVRLVRNGTISGVDTGYTLCANISNVYTDLAIETDNATVYQRNGVLPVVTGLTEWCIPSFFAQINVTSMEASTGGTPFVWPPAAMCMSYGSRSVKVSVTCYAPLEPLPAGPPAPAWPGPVSDATATTPEPSALSTEMLIIVAVVSITFVVLVAVVVVVVVLRTKALREKVMPFSDRPHFVPRHPRTSVSRSVSAADARTYQAHSARQRDYGLATEAAHPRASPAAVDTVVVDDEPIV